VNRLSSWGSPGVIPLTVAEAIIWLLSYVDDYMCLKVLANCC